MRPTLRYGSRGAAVVELQKGLNLLASKLAPLTPDGIYGSKTTARVREVQSTHQLVADGITGPKTWQMVLDLLAKVQQGGIPIAPQLPGAAVDALRPIVLVVAQQHLGTVDFGVIVGGRPKGIDFLIEMFQVAANVTLTDQNFIDPKTKAWSQEPWIHSPTEKRKSWCGLFCVYCYRKAGLNVTWSLKSGRPLGQVRLNTFGPGFVANIKQADIGCVAHINHHFLIESVDGSGHAPSLTTLDGNQWWGRILRVPNASTQAHRVGKDNFNYYSII